MHLRPAATSDADAITRIYNDYIRESIVTFETREIAPGEIARRIEETIGSGLPWIVAVEGDRLVGYAYASKWKDRYAYRYSVESTIYLESAVTGRGIGRNLYASLLDEIRKCGMHVVIGGISLPNPASVGLHEALGFRKIGQFEQVGYKFDRWIDVGYWQLTLLPG
jgi:phosphinothricin acetyltransferase